MFYISQNQTNGHSKFLSSISPEEWSDIYSEKIEFFSKEDAGAVVRQLKESRLDVLIFDSEWDIAHPKY